MHLKFRGISVFLISSSLISLSARPTYQQSIVKFRSIDMQAQVIYRGARFSSAYMDFSATDLLLFSSHHFYSATASAFFTLSLQNMPDFVDIAITERFSPAICQRLPHAASRSTRPYLPAPPFSSATVAFLLVRCFSFDLSSPDASNFWLPLTYDFISSSISREHFFAIRFAE